MTGDLTWMIAPAVACLLVAGALGWFGLHVLQRGVIFVDLALAQIAALGATLAVYLGYAADGPAGLALSLGFTVLGALLFAGIRAFEDRVPPEALIGISYAVSAALGILLVELADDPHGAEKVQHLLVGNVVWVRWSEIGVAAAAVAVVGVLHAAVGRRFLEISFDPDGARRRGVNLAAWDLLFYLSFGVVLTAIVHIVGVLLVFSFLVVPAVIARLFADRTGARLAIAWGVGAAASVLGVAVSYEHSTGPIVVAILGAVLAASLVVEGARRAERPAAWLARLGAVGAGIALMLLGIARLAPAEDPHEHHGEHEAADAQAAPGAAATTTAPEAEDPLARLERAVRLARDGDAEGLRLLAELVRDAPPFVRMEADARLRAVAGDAAPDLDPLAGPDAEGAWAAWAKHPPAGWEERARGMELP